MFHQALHGTNLKAVPRIAGDKIEDILSHFRSETPVIVEASSLAKSACEKWTPEYLSSVFPKDLVFNVYCSPNGIFRYWSEKDALWEGKFDKPTELREMSFAAFYENLISHRQINKPAEFQYLQQGLHTNVGPQFTQDFCQLQWPFVTAVQQTLDWGDLTTNLLLVGPKGSVTPAHFDEQENMFAQIRGVKRFLLLAPDQYRCMYPFPAAHPCDRQSQVDLYAPDLTKFPAFAEAVVHEAVVREGDVLYIPNCWWHHVETLEESVSLTFWFKIGAATAQRQSAVAIDTGRLTVTQKISLRRNIEKIMQQLAPTRALREEVLEHYAQHSDDVEAHYAPSARPLEAASGREMTVAEIATKVYGLLRIMVNDAEAREIMADISYRYKTTP